MKKIFLILALTILVNIGATAQTTNADIVVFRDREWTQGIDGKEENNNLADSFMTAFGMSIEAGGSTGESAPGMGTGGLGGNVVISTSTISIISTNQVTPPFTPYSYKK